MCWVGRTGTGRIVNTPQVERRKIVYAGEIVKARGVGGDE
jgi:hypothetical protein